MVMLALTGCDDAMYQPSYAIAQPPTLTQIQGQCFSEFKAFPAQANCIANAVSAIGLAPDAGVQEYLLLLESLKEQAARKTLSENDARLKLAGKLSELKVLQQNQDAVLQQLEYQRAAQNAEILRQYQSNIIKPQPYQPYTSPRMQTNCQALGNQVNCTSR
jgi:hypothetical protein